MDVLPVVIVLFLLVGAVFMSYAAGFNGWSRRNVWFLVSVMTVTTVTLWPAFAFTLILFAPMYYLGRYDGRSAA